MAREFEHWVEVMNRRGHAGVFAATSHEERKIVERTVVEEWANAMHYLHGEQITDIASAKDDPPDCTAFWNGRPVTVELTELVDGDLLAISDRARKQGTRQTAYDVLFDQAQWTEDRFINLINKRIDDKDRRYGSKDLRFDILIIYSGEPWLMPGDVKKWISPTTFSARDSFRTAFLTLDYDPSCPDHWPVLTLFKDT